MVKNSTGRIVKIENKVKWGGKGYGFLQRRDYKRITVDVKGRRVMFDSDSYNHIDHIYCTTTYKIQSSSDKRIIANFDTKQFNVNSANDILVKTSRSKAELILFTNDSKSLYDAVKRECEKVGITDFTGADFKQHMAGEEKNDKAELLTKIADRFEYENAAFSQGDFAKGAMAIYEEMRELEETMLELELEEPEIRGYFEQKVREDEYFEVGELKKIPYFSTEENIEIENRIYERSLAAKRPENQVPGFSFHRVQEYLDTSTLTEGQKQAVLFITGSKHRLRAIQAAPGTGVPFLLNFVRDFYEREGNYKVVALAPSNMAARNLKEKAGFDNANTLHAHFIQLQKEAGTWEADRDPLDLRLADFTGLSPGSHREIWVVDRAALIDNCAMDKLLEAAELKRAEVGLTGDYRELQPVGAGKPFTNLIKTGKTGYVELDEIVRQREVWRVFDSRKLSDSDRDKILRRAFKQEAAVTFFNGRPGDSIKPDQLEKLPLKPGREVTIFRDTNLKEAVNRVVHDEITAALDLLQNHITEVKDDDARHQRIAETYTSLSTKKREQTFVITGINRDRIKINHLVREILKDRGELAEGQVFTVRDNRDKEQEREFAPGDRVVFLKSEEVSGQEFKKDESGIVKKIEILKDDQSPSQMDKNEQKFFGGPGGDFSKKPPDEDSNPEMRIVIETKETTFVVDPAEYNYIEHAYCATAYKVQSAGDRSRVLAHIDTKQYNVNNSNDLLVKLSSAEREITIFTDDAKSLYDSVKGEQNKVSIYDFASGGPEPFCKKVPTPPKTFDNKQLLIENISGKFEYRHAAFTQGDFIFGGMDIYSDLLSLNETEIEINASELKDYFDNRIKTGYFCEVGNLGTDTYFSTGQNINTENGIYERAASARNKLTGFKESKVDRYLDSTTLNPGQKDALLFLTTGKDRIRAVQGAPGVGKSFMLNAAKNFYEEEGYKVVALAPSNEAAAGLKAKAGFDNASTIHAYLIRLQKEAGAWDSDRDPLNLRETNLSDLTPGAHKEIWFMDEASLIDNNAMDRLLEAAEKKNAEIALVGDTNQLQPVGAGRPHTNMLKEKIIDHVEVTDIMRQKQEWRIYHLEKMSKADKNDIVERAKAIKNNAAVTFFKGPPPDKTIEKQPTLSKFQVESFKTVSGVEIDIHMDSSLQEAVKEAVDHNISASINKLGDRVEEIEDNMTRFGEIASRFAGLPAHEREEAVIVTSINEDRTAINDFVHELLKEKGELGKGSDFLVTDIKNKKHVREFSLGDKVIFLQVKEFDGHLVKKNHVGKIKKIESSNLIVTTRGKDIVIPADKYNYFDHAYCRTTYRVQGADYKTVFANIDTRQSMVNSMNDYLIKISRAVRNLVLFTDDRYKLYKTVNKEQFKVSINDFKAEFFRKSEQQAISRLIEGIARRDFADSRLPRTVKNDLQRGDAHYVKYLHLRQKASDAISQADSLLKGRFSSEKARQEAEAKTLNHLDIDKKADYFRNKSEFYYKRALSNYTEATTRMAKSMNVDKLHHAVFEQQFEKDYIPGGRITFLGELNIETKTHSSELGNPSVSELEHSLDFVEPESLGLGHDQDSFGFEGPGDDGDFPGVEPEDGGIDGPGISRFD
ncbi:ATP-dependent RecD-like DNA helicase [Acidobacteriota bacterium]